MDIKKFAQMFPERIRDLQRFVEGEDIKHVMGVEATNHFKDSFRNEGFTDETLNPWKDVKRRDKESPWYGHSGQTGKFSAERATAPILTGETRELQNAITYRPIPGGVRVSNDKPYAAVHQYGLPARIYGKKLFVMQARPFIGKSAVLMRNIEDKIKREFIRILQSK